MTRVAHERLVQTELTDRPVGHGNHFWELGDGHADIRVDVRETGPARHDGPVQFVSSRPESSPLLLFRRPIEFGRPVRVEDVRMSIWSSSPPADRA
jgi:hypothetical protein